MTEMTEKPKPPRPTLSLEASYRNALYEVAGDDPLVLRIGAAVPLSWLQHRGAHSATLITAWNPFSRELPEPVNLARLQQLRRAVDAAGLRHLPARGCDPSGLWTPEPGLCVLDLAEALAGEWLREYEQFAAVVADARGCRLLWHPEVTAPSTEA